MKFSRLTLQVLIICFFTICQSSVVAQDLFNYISMKTKYDFALPQLQANLSLPPNTGFKVYFSSKEKQMTDLKDDYVVCFFDTATVRSGQKNHINFKFGKDLLNLSISLPKTNLISSTVANTKGFVDFLPSISTKEGKTSSFKINDNTGKSFDQHIIDYNDYRFTFTLESAVSPKVKKEMMKSISSFKHKEYPHDIKFYNDRQDFKVLKKDIEETKAPLEYNRMEKLDKKFAESSTYHFELLNLSVTMPPQTTAYLQGSSFETDENTNTIKLDRIDFLSQQMGMNTLLCDNLNLMIRTYFAGRNTTQEMVEGLIKNNMSTLSEEKEIVLDGLTLKANISGSRDLATLDTYYEIDGNFVWISLSGIEKSTEDLTNQILSSIRINSSKPKSGRVDKPFSSIFKLETVPKIEIDKTIDFPKIEATNNPISISPLNLKFNPIEPYSAYVTSTGSEKPKAIANGIVSRLSEQPSEMTRIYNPKNYLSSISIYIPMYDNDQMDLETRAKYFKRSYSSYKDYKVIKAGTAKYNNLGWVFIIWQTPYGHNGMAYTYIDDYEIMVGAYNSSLEDVYKNMSIIQSFVIEK